MLLLMFISSLKICMLGSGSCSFCSVARRGGSLWIRCWDRLDVARCFPLLARYREAVCPQSQYRKTIVPLNTVGNNVLCLKDANNLMLRCKASTIKFSFPRCQKTQTRNMWSNARSAIYRNNSKYEHDPWKFGNLDDLGLFDRSGFSGFFLLAPRWRAICRPCAVLTWAWEALTCCLAAALKWGTMHVVKGMAERMETDGNYGTHEMFLWLWTRVEAEHFPAEACCQSRCFERHSCRWRGTWTPGALQTCLDTFRVLTNGTGLHRFSLMSSLDRSYWLEAQA